MRPSQTGSLRHVAKEFANIIANSSSSGAYIDGQKNSTIMDATSRAKGKFAEPGVLSGDSAILLGDETRRREYNARYQKKIIALHRSQGDEFALLEEASRSENFIQKQRRLYAAHVRERLSMRTVYQ